MISIITITFNNYEELIKTLNSVPIEENVESVVINGGDCEKTKDFLNTYHGKSVSEKDKGIADAFNKGIKISSGDFIMFLNSGDILLSTNYLHKAKLILDHNPDLAFVHSNIFFSDQLGSDLYMKPQMKSVGRGMPYHHQTMIVRKKLFEEIGMFKKELKYAMDFDFVVRMERRNFKGFYLDEEAVVRMDGKGVSINEESSSIKECFKVLRSEKYFNLKNSVGYIIRFSLYSSRKLLELTGGKILLKKLKQSKHKDQTNL